MKQHFEHFLVTTDFSESGDRAVSVAFRLAADHDAKVTMCHVLDAVRPPNPVYAHYYPKELFKPGAAREAEENALRELRSRVPAETSEVQYDCVVSHGVLDSMPFSVALQTMREVDRVLSPDGLAYVDLISGDDDRHYREYAGEEVVEGPHETGTIQSYFNLAKIHRLVEDTGLEVREAVLVRRMRVDAPRIDARYHLVLGRP